MRSFRRWPSGILSFSDRIGAGPEIAYVDGCGGRVRLGPLDLGKMVCHPFHQLSKRQLNLVRRHICTVLSHGNTHLPDT